MPPRDASDYVADREAAEEGPPPPRPNHRDRRASSAFIGAFVLLQIALPLRYYLAPSTDERFAWRMFSSRRLERCRYTLVADGEPIDVNRHLGVGPFTVDTLPRGEPDVVVGLMRWWCRRGDAIEVRYENACLRPDGEVPPPRRASLRCADGALDRQELP